MSGATHLMWTTSRAAGITAVMLASLSVCVGLLISRPMKRRGPDRKTVHEALALATLCAIAIHAGALLLDPWLKPGIGGVLVPLQSSYRPTAVAAGVLAGYGLAILGLAYYARSRIGPARWKRAHRWTALFWALAVVHGFTAGSDAGQPWFIAAVALVALPATYMLASRASERSGHGSAPRPSPVLPAGPP